MPTLNWIGKEAVVKHHKEVPFRLLEPVPRYAGQVKCIYIDPPYNTGQDDRGADGQRTGWIYND